MAELMLLGSGAGLTSEVGEAGSPESPAQVLTLPGLYLGARASPSLPV